jgi:hypothetical protein
VLAVDLVGVHGVEGSRGESRTACGQRRYEHCCDEDGRMGPDAIAHGDSLNRRCLARVGPTTHSVHSNAKKSYWEHSEALSAEAL